MATDKHRSLEPNIGKSTPVLACSERFAICESDVSAHKGQKQHTCLQASFIATELVHESTLVTRWRLRSRFSSARAWRPSRILFFTSSASSVTRSDHELSEIAFNK